jgi:uncharacterized protein with HEPN domain
MNKYELIRTMQRCYVESYTAETEEEKQFIQDHITACKVALCMLGNAVQTLPEVSGLNRIGNL